VDIDETKVDLMKSGKVPIYEPGLEPIFKRNIESGRLQFTTSLKQGVSGAEVIFLALPTPPGADGSADLSFILEVAENLGPLLKEYAVIVDKSTVPVGTSKKVSDMISKNAKVDFDVVSNPEFLREGLAVEDTMKPDRVVIGSSSARAFKVMTDLYMPFVQDNQSIVTMDESSAEMTKYAANSMLATRISFMNEVANMCDLTGADVESVRAGIGADHRIGKYFLHPGIGYGGSCFPKDVKALRQTAQENGYDFKVLDAVETVNQAQRLRMVEKISKHYSGKLQGKTFALWGLAFKPDTDDIREAPAIDIARVLIDQGATITAYDPEAIANVKKQHPNLGLNFALNPYDALKKADALIITTEWDEFKSPDWAKITKTMAKPVIFDGRNVFDLEMMQGKGFFYQSIGRRTIHG
jgi:UDPglucose 6-dehydrogenase